MTDGADGLVMAWCLGADERWSALNWEGLRAWSPADGALWVHLDGADDQARSWLTDESGLDPVIQDALLATETRPRCMAVGDALLAILRGVNLNPGADPEDMVGVRIWVEAGRMISVRLRPLMAARSVQDELDKGRGPASLSGLFVAVVEAMVERMSAILEDLDDDVDRLEDEMLTESTRESRSELASIRRQAIALRRYLAPQRDALSRLHAEDLSWLDRRKKARLRETADRVIRYVEDLDAIRERAAVIQDELMNRMSDQMNRNMYLLTLVSAIMLPLGFLTGLLGINVGGMPGAETSWAFWAVCVLCLIVAGLGGVILRRMKWF